MRRVERAQQHPNTSSTARMGSRSSAKYWFESQTGVPPPQTTFIHVIGVSGGGEQRERRGTGAQLALPVVPSSVQRTVCLFFDPPAETSSPKRPSVEHRRQEPSLPSRTTLDNLLGASFPSRDTCIAARKHGPTPEVRGWEVHSVLQRIVFRALPAWVRQNSA